ncbi:MAG: hypothetical protein PF489_08765 [Salinivirgaceae bacterium]|jgi:threonine/homoserine/homoserine lactone efflux protein|nr:hypothetical protein [Salinivirgaceae bacterium]
MKKNLKNATGATLIIAVIVFLLNLFEGLTWWQNIKMLVVVFAVWWVILFIFVSIFSQFKRRNNGK